MTIDGRLVPLRRTIQPYVGQIAILVFVTAFAVWVSATSSDWRFMWAPGVFLPLYAFYFLYFGMRYKVLWTDSEVVMQASGGSERRVPFDEITSVKSEVSSLSDVLAQSRPFRRIAIQGRVHDSKARVDISLHHFNLNDLNQLLTAIHAHRPDLDMPTIQGGKAARGGHAS